MVENGTFGFICIKQQTRLYAASFVQKLHFSVFL